MSQERITIDEVKKVASLCKLSFSDEELILLQGDLSKILDYVASLQELNVKEVVPTFTVILKKNILENDCVSPSIKREDVLVNAANKDVAYIRTKAVL
ncbi:MAG: Asp-tRNA(Asn)/Glu-tRNA(Gln) amidotransferase subunit GatC [Patescibacteria group bacterium]